jgi:hypothetical protein
MKQCKDKWKDEYERVHSWSQDALQQLEEEPTTEFDRRWQEAVRANIAVAQELDRDLKEIGVPFDIGELGNVRLPYPEALPTLLRHLHRRYPDDIERAILRALTVPYGGRVVFETLDEYLRQHHGRMSEHNLFALGNAISVAASKQDVGALIDIVRTREYGHARLQPLLRIARFKHPLVAQTVTNFFEHEKLLPWCGIRALRLAKIWSAASDVRPFLDSFHASVRAEARKFLKLAEAHSAKAQLSRHLGKSVGRPR